MNGSRWFASLVFMLGSVQVHAAGCTTSGDKVIAPTSTCDAEPNYFAITLYELGLCTAAPTAPTTGAAFDSGNVCVAVYENSAGVRLLASTDVNDDPLDARFISAPPLGAYTHGYAKLRNVFQIQFESEFTTSLTGEAAGEGAFCRTANATLYNDQKDASGNAASFARMVCDGDFVWPGTMNWNLVDLGGSQSLTGFTGIDGDTLDIYLTDGDQQLSPDRSSVTQILGIQTFSSTQRMGSGTNSFRLKLNASEAVYLENTGGTIAIGATPFTLSVELVNSN